MNTHEFLRKQIDQQLQAEGFSPKVTMQVADEALDFYNRTAHFKKGALHECLTFARKRAKETSALAGEKRRA
ncbi:hypothetical protein [Pseudomonas sp. zfem003]|uniref:hypothetical protein n=1 Tax=Pseudomonas sp. zfem003 TaxID=3078198 RepID=UPI0029294AD2|nr:hypothetical protein [Pseudomonas sp. zfem003]MDU9398085.1 hypothetical protein [Pseudomonas sp. zfem003]